MKEKKKQREERRKAVKIKFLRNQHAIAHISNWNWIHFTRTQINEKWNWNKNDWCTEWNEKKTTNNLPCESLIEFYKYISFCTTCYCWKSLCFFANSFWLVRTLNHLYSNAIWFGNESFFLLCRRKLLLKEDLKWKPIDRIYFWFIWSFSHHLTMWFILTFFLSFVDIYYTKSNAAKNYSDWYTHSGFQGIHTYEEKYGNDFWVHLLCICGEHSLVLLFQIKYIICFPNVRLYAHRYFPLDT